MRLPTIVMKACVLVLWGLATAQAQTYLGERTNEPTSVLRPASTTMWRNYVTVPDGPCGCPMSVEADCYNPSSHPCGPLRPICFTKRVVRMLDCLLPCNMCCGGGGGALFHGCHLGGKTWGHCSVCCGGPACGSCGTCDSCGPACGDGCCPNPAGSVFDCVPCCTSGGHCTGCSCTGVADPSAPPGLSNPFQDDPVPPVPQPTSLPGAEVRRHPNSRLKPVSAPTKENQTTAAAPSPSPYKIVSKPAKSAPPATQTSPATSSRRHPVKTAAVEEIRAVPAKPVLRPASAETKITEPAPHTINHARTSPIIRSQSPDENSTSSIPANPLR